MTIVLATFATDGAIYREAFAWLKFIRVAEVLSKVEDNKAKVCEKTLSKWKIQFRNDFSGPGFLAVDE